MTDPLIDLSGASPLLIPPLPGERQHHRLSNGLRVALVHNPQAPVVTCALWYRAGTRDEGPQEGGAAHFLEHMMFKGSRRFGPGVVDRRTQAHGGTNNAFTSHEATAYYFSFARDRWPLALEIEADRMEALTLDPDETASERQVVLEEIAMYEGEPWDALEMKVQSELYGDHPYGKPVLGTRESLGTLGPEELRAFHRRHYRPGNAVLVVAGDLEAGHRYALERVEQTFGAIEAGAASAPFPQAAAPALGEWRRVERRRGETARLILAARVPGVLEGGDVRPSYAALQLASTVLSGGRASRLQRRLVDEGQLCSWVSSHLTEGAETATFSVSLEVLPGVSPARVEEELFAVLQELASGPPGERELERARRVQLADWVFANERIHQQAMTLGFDLILFQEDHGRRLTAASLASTPQALSAAMAEAVDPRSGGIIGWSLPES
ncbi:MAG: pitrilysin family protein [Acidobacteriota bacterium]